MERTSGFGSSPTGENAMAPKARRYGIAVLLSLAHLVVLTPCSFGQLRQAVPPQIPGKPIREGPPRPTYFLPPYNHFLNYPLTPYVGVGQAAAMANTLAFASAFGFPPPGYNPVA